ncbi:Pancreas/duodenum homeobox protein 1 [Candidatus Magnetomoraceae bacterium gMMP-15]
MIMTSQDFHEIFTEYTMEDLFPGKDRTDLFFDALFGDTMEGAYDISLKFKEYTKNELQFEFHLTSRPGRCLACMLTLGLPEVFAVHPVIHLNGLLQDIKDLLKGKVKCAHWKIGSTHEISRDLHIIPFTVFLEE